MAPDDSASRPVVIAGAGPAGLVLAWILHREGVPVLVVDRASSETLGQAPKAGTVEHRIARLLVDEGLGDPVLALDVENRRCEFRTPHESVQLDYAALAGGHGHVVFPQHRLVRRLAEHLDARGVPLWFEHEVVEVVEDTAAGQEAPGGTTTGLVLEGPDGARREVRAQVVVGADGAASTVAAAVAAAPGTVVHDRHLPGRWLVVAAASPPLVDHTIYAAHPRGFAGHLRRGPEETRFYLEVPGDQGPREWSHDAVRAELDVRLGAGGAVERMDVTGVGTLDLRTRLVAPLQHGGLFLVGDAAHLVTPAGGKGMNLALGDAVELAHGLVERFGPRRDGARLAAYSERRLPAIRRAQAFSDWFLRILSARSAGTGTDGTDDADDAGYVHDLREGWVSALRTDPLLARWFAHAYAGVDA